MEAARYTCLTDAGGALTKDLEWECRMNTKRNLCPVSTFPLPPSTGSTLQPHACPTEQEESALTIASHKLDQNLVSPIITEPTRMSQLLRAIASISSLTGTWAAS
jgi:hypothetical protein